LCKNSKSVPQIEIVLWNDWRLPTWAESHFSKIYLSKKFYMWLAQEIFSSEFCCRA
jgi:hypothetical protein